MNRHFNPVYWVLAVSMRNAWGIVAWAFAIGAVTGYLIKAYI